MRNHSASNHVKQADSWKLVVSMQDRQIFSDDGYTYDLKPQFLNLYLYLVLRRLDDHRKRGGFVDVEEILLLPHWERNTLESVGKQIRRHILQMAKEGRNIIEAQQKISGPFRISIPPDQIILDVPIVRLMEFLDLRHISMLAPEKEEDFYSYVGCMWEGDAFFNKGKLKDALSQYKEAEEAAARSNLQELKIAALQKTGRTMERFGDLQIAEELYRDVLKSGALNESAEAQTYVLLSLIKYREGNLKASEDFSYKALDLVRGKKQYKIMGGVFNCLGLVRKERKSYLEAIPFFQRALEYYSLVDYFYGIQAAYFNLGLIYKLLGDGWIESDTRLRNDQYRKSIEWVQRCISLCNKMGIAFETSQDHILLASIYRKMGEMDKAMRHVNTAIEVATIAGNTRDLAHAHRILAVIKLNMGKQDEAKAAFKLFYEYLEQTGLSRDTLNNIVQETIRKLAKEMSPDKLNILKKINVSR